MSAASWPASCSPRRFVCPRAAIGPTTPMKASSGSPLWESDENSAHSRGGHHVSHGSFLAVLHVFGDSAGLAPAHAGCDADAQDRAVGARAELARRPPRAPTGDDETPGLSR